MRILKTTQTYYPYVKFGGPPAKIRGIAKALVQRKHEVTVLTACHPETEADEPLNAPTSLTTSGSWKAQDRGVEAIYLPTTVSYRAATINPYVRRFCRNRLQEFDVVHVYGLYDWIGTTVASACRRRHIPYVLEPLGMFGPKMRSKGKKRVFHALFGRALVRGAQKLIATSETERQELLNGGVPANKIVVRRNGLDLTEFQSLPARGKFRGELNIDTSKKLLLFLGRLSLIKGLDLLVQAIAKLPDDVVLVIAGRDDQDGCMELVSKLVEDLKLQDRVIQSDPLFGEKKLEAFVDADVFVLPSRYESFGNAAAEAIACGVPVVVTNECGIAPLIDGRAGVVTPATVEGLRDGLARILENTELRSQLKAGLKSVAQSLSWDEPVKEMEQLYLKISGLGVRAESEAVLAASENTHK